MANFRFELNSDLLKIALAIVAAHGVTDLDNCWWIVVYPFCLALPDSLTTPIFFILSILHFYDDLGVFGSIVLHSLIILSVVLKRQNMGFKSVVFFIVFVHVPLHYARCIHNHRYAALAIAAISTYVSVVISQTRKVDIFLFTESIQKVVCAHVIVESLLKHRI